MPRVPRYLEIRSLVATNWDELGIFDRNLLAQKAANRLALLAENTWHHFSVAMLMSHVKTGQVPCVNSCGIICGSGRKLPAGVRSDGAAWPVIYQMWGGVMLLLIDYIYNLLMGACRSRYGTPSHVTWGRDTRSQARPPPWQRGASAAPPSGSASKNDVSTQQTRAN